MLVRILDGVDAFLDQLGSVDLLPLALAIGCHLLKMACTSRAWRNVLAAAYPEERVPWISIYGAYLAGVGINAIIPARAGDAVRIVLAHRAIPGSTYTTVVSSTLVLSFFDMFAASLFLAWAVSLGELPGLDVLARLESFDFAWLFSRPLLFDLSIADDPRRSSASPRSGSRATWPTSASASRRRSASCRRQPATSRRSCRGRPRTGAAPRHDLVPPRCVRHPADARERRLVQVSTSVATLFPITPAGIGTEQAFLLYVLSGVASASVLLAFSVGAKLTLTLTNVVAGFTAIALTLRTVRFKKGSRAAAEEADGELGRAGLVELRVEVARGLLREAGNALELLLRGLEEALDGAEVPDDRAPPHRPDAGKPLEDRLHRARAPLAPVVAERDAVRLVADALEELERGARAVEHDRRREPGHEDLLLALRERDDRDARQVELLHRGQRRGELPLSAVDDDEVRHPREALVRARRRGARANRRETASRIAPTSSWPSSPRIANLR